MNWKSALTTGFLVVLAGEIFAAGVNGRYVRIDALTHAIENSELEIFSGEKNILRGHPAMLSSGKGWGWYGMDENLGMRQRLVDGNTDTNQRGTTRSPDPKTSFASIEADLGGTVPVDKVVFYVSRYDNPMIKKWFVDPEGWRVVSVLDADRKVVFSQLVTLYTPAYMKAKGVVSVEPMSGKGPFVGRQVLPESRSWFSLGEFFVEYLGVKPLQIKDDPECSARVDEFSRRNSTESMVAFAQHFLERLIFPNPIWLR